MAKAIAPGAGSAHYSFLMGEMEMHGRTSRWLACVLAGAMASGAASVAMAQQGYPTTTDPGYFTAGDPGAPSSNRMAANVNYAADESDLAARVKDLEAALKKIKDKEADAKKKAEGKPSVTVGGRVYFDNVFFGQNELSRDTLGDAQDTSYFRTARLFVEGEGFDVMYYKVEFDIAGRSDFTTSSALDPPDDHTHTVAGVGQIVWKDVYVGIQELPILGKVQVGNFKEPFSLEEITSSRFITFMERGLPNAVFSPAYNPGVMAMRVAESQNATFAIGAFRTAPENPPYIANDDLGVSCTMRGTWLPWYDEVTAGRGLLHLGFSYRYTDFDNPAQRLRARPEVGTGPYIVDTGSFGDNLSANTIDPEVAFVYGPLSMQAEYMQRCYDRTNGAADASFNGGYVFVSYFLTGENRNYKRTKGAFDRVTPYENFFRVRAEDGCVYTGRGAWELAYRYSFLDLDDETAAVFGGFARDHTFGLNWYLNPYTRMMFNLVHSDVSSRNEGPNTFIDVYEMRAQVDF